ncbi:TIGR02587 family membrane protein [Consotaella salsifontis]|uniref:Putative integral membrane protein TIGR02587 n=1 Tax=Consotaella salsifontis TaxID=1365950 RepID=A0A1T4L1A4_9HYPH|nr:TIGR02587 family membrane protein [Consotaella salsifontis]SJZ48317.1 putative integral membrane protein TIGR02587 [Consotaella salsifontis]
MTDTARDLAARRSELRSKFLVGLARAAGGALIFSLPTMMTQEMWDLGFTINRWRLALLVMIHIPLLALLAAHIGFERTSGWIACLRDAVVAYALGMAVSAAILGVFGIIGPGMPAREIIDKIALQAVGASLGALLARSQLGGDEPEPEGHGSMTYASELFLMAIGALFLGLNVAPTEEVRLISYRMTEWHALALIGLSILVMHAFVFTVGFHGEETRTPHAPWWSDFLRFTIAGYALACLVSLYVLWTFGQVDGAAFPRVLMSTVVLGFPTSVGAAAARLIL